MATFVAGGDAAGNVTAIARSAPAPVTTASKRGGQPSSGRQETGAATADAVAEAGGAAIPGRRHGGPSGSPVDRQVAPADAHVCRQLRTLQRVMGNPTDAVLARRSGMSAAAFSEVMSGRRRPHPKFVAKVVVGCLAYGREHGADGLDEKRVLEALRLPDHTATDLGILERDEDLNRCSAVLEAVRARAGGVIVIEGPAGIGKSELLARVRVEAAVRGVVPLTVQASERDQTMAFGAARTLLARWVAARSIKEQDLLFADAAGLARIPLGLPYAQSVGPGAMIGLTEALYWLVAHATALPSDGCREQPLLLVIDDAHWLDEESLTWLGFVGQRMAGLPMVLALAYRPREPRLAPVLAELALRADVVIRPCPLSQQAVEAVVNRSLPQRTSRRGTARPPDADFCAAFWQRSGGNPFYLRQMLDLARERGLAPVADNVGQVADLTPQQVVTYLTARLAALGTAAQRLARAVAVFGSACTLTDAGRLARLSTAEAKIQYDRLCHASILSANANLDFCHPIIRSAVYDDTDPSLRSDGHRAAAHLLHDRQAGADEVSAHLLETQAGADAWVVDVLCAAAGQAMGKGLAATAARYLKRAVQEPPPPAQRCTVQLRYGQALALGPLTAAIPELLAAYQQAPDGLLRTEAATSLAKTYGYADLLGDSVRFLDSAIKVCPDESARQRLVAEQLLWSTWWADDPHRPDRMRQLEQMATTTPSVDNHTHRLLRMLHAWNLVLRGEPRDTALSAVRPVIARGLAFTDVDDGMELGINAGFVPMYCGELATARAIFDQAVEDFHRDGWRGTHLAFARAHQGNVALREGRLYDAVADADIALRAADRAGEHTPAGWFATGTLIEALLARGNTDMAATVCAYRDYAGRRPHALVLPMSQAVCGSLWLARGELDRAVYTLREVGRWLDDHSLTNPAWCPWRFDLALALRRAARPEADQIASVAQRHADRFGCPSTRGRALRVLAALRPTDAIDLLEESVRVLSDAPARFEYAQSLAHLGTALARSGNPAAARQRLVEALTLADECGGSALRALIAPQLPRVGVNTVAAPPARNSLPARQRRVAGLAAQGRSDADIAYAMILDLDAVADLRRGAYDKLHVTSRTELGRALALWP